MFDQVGLNLAGLADWLGIRPISLLALTLLAMGLFNLAGRLIPDNATGWLGVVRKACKILGIFIQNRVLSGVSVGELALHAAGTAKRADAIATVAAEAQGIEILSPPPPPSPSELAGRSALGATPTGVNGFITVKLLMILTICIGVTGAAVILSSCAAVPVGIQVGHIVCNNRDDAQKLLDSLRGDHTSPAAQKVFAILAITCPLLLPTPVTPATPS